jgi:hypothetical protein
MAGIAIALFGLLGLAPELRRLASARSLASLRGTFSWGESWPVRAIAVALIACGAGLGTNAVVLAGTARLDAVGDWDIPALHSAASDRPLPAAQICTHGFPVCVDKAFSFYLGDVAAALQPVAAEIAGLPGAPVKVAEVASLSGGQVVMSGIVGHPPVFDYTAEHVGTMFGEFFGIPGPASFWRASFQLGLLDAFLAAPHPAAGSPPLGAAQQAVENALLAAVGTTPSEAGGQQILNGEATSGASPAIAGATRRFLALPASARRAWLGPHLAGLRAGTTTLAQIP